MSNEILARSGAYTLTRFAGPGGCPMLQVTATGPRGGSQYVQLPVDCLGSLARDLTDLVLRESEASDGS